MIYLLQSLLGYPQMPFPVIDTPAQGDFTQLGSVTVTGHIDGDAPLVTLLTVNGAPATVNPDGTFSASVTLDPNVVFQPVVAEVVRVGGTVVRDRVTLVYGDSIADGDYSPNAVALRLNDRGIDQVEPIITDLVDLDLAALLPPGTVVIDEYCYLDLGWLGCGGSVRATVSGNPPPSIGDLAIDVDSQTDYVFGDVVLSDLFIRAQIDDVVGVGLSCTADIRANTTDIEGDYALGATPDGYLDVSQIGGVNVIFGSFSDNTNCGGLLGGVVEFFIDLLIGDLQGIVEPEIENFLNTTDGNGNTPVAGAIEDALNSVEISGPIGEAIGLSLETPIYDVYEDVDGISLDNDARITASMPDPLAPDLTASYHIPEPFPTYGANSPGGLPYGMAIGISPSAFNQLLKAEIESGLLRVSLTELDLGGGPLPINAGLLSLFIPELRELNPALPMTIDLTPVLAPVITSDPGPFGEIAELQIGHLEATITAPRSGLHPGGTFLKVAVDAHVGLNLAMTGGTLDIALGTLDSSALDVNVLENPLFTNEAAIEALLVALLPELFPSLAGSLGSFPLPEFLGMQLQEVDVGKQGGFLSIYVDLVPAGG